MVENHQKSEATKKKYVDCFMRYLNAVSKTPDDLIGLKVTGLKNTATEVEFVAEQTLENYLNNNTDSPDINITVYDKKFRQLYRKLFVLNCWHMNDEESDAMCGLYATRIAGIAVQSTFKRLKDSFNADNQHQESIGIVEYINYEKAVIEGILRFLSFYVQAT